MNLSMNEEKNRRKKHKHQDFEYELSMNPKKRQKIMCEPIMSHITITFANINDTIDAIILPKQNVLAMNNDILLANKDKLSIKTSDPIQHDIIPEIPIDIKILSKPNGIKTIHPRNSFRMGTSLFYCSD
eukprot:18149_1